MNPMQRQHVERICRSETFRTTPRLRELLVFLTSDGDPSVLKEAVIGVEFFHRDPGYDSKKDPIGRQDQSIAVMKCIKPAAFSEIYPFLGLHCKKHFYDNLAYQELVETTAVNGLRLNHVRSR